MEVPSSKSYILKPLKKNPADNFSSLKEEDFKINYASELNERQLEAVRTTEGPVLCIAGAGSGKTRTLIYRVAYLIEKGVAPENILLLTFTRKAAQEMMRRASNILDERCRQIKGGTFHGFANMILRRFAKQAELEANFTILDRGDAEDLLNLLRTELGLSKTDSRFPKKKTLLEIFSKSINTGKEIEEIIRDEFFDFYEEHSAITNLYHSYQKLKRARGLLDYDDLLVELKMLLTCNADIRERLSNEYRYIMIDEFQDTNIIQSDISSLLASSHNNILAVGDDAQSVYSFRGAEFRNIMDFPKKYSNCKIISLEQNYRSTQSILKFANSLLDSAKEKYPKKLFSNIESEQKPVFIRPETITEQASFIAQRILELREEGVELNKIAVLFRAAWHSNELEIELQHCNIPFIKFGGIKFVEAAHIKDMLAFLKVSVNHRDPTSWYRLLMLHEGIGAKTASDLTQKLTEGSNELSVLLEQKKKKYGSALEQLREMILFVSKSSNKPAPAVEKIKEYYYPILKKHHDDYRKRIDDLASLSQLSERHKSIESFLDDLTLEAPDAKLLNDDNSLNKNDEYLTLSTIHSAKGLEWHSVFIINLNDGFIPSSRVIGNEKEMEEERRLLYVACTRAEHNLYLSSPYQLGGRSYSMYGGGTYSFTEPSRFLGEIHDLASLIEHWSLEQNSYDW